VGRIEPKKEGPKSQKTRTKKQGPKNNPALPSSSHQSITIFTTIRMNREEIRSKLILILKKYTRKPEVWETATDDASILIDLKINSARIVDIALDIEDTFNIEIDDPALDRITTIKSGIQVIEELTA
jgi:acyl carrier protein